MEGVRFDVAVVHNEWRDTESWVLSEMPVENDIISLLQIGHFDVLNMMIQEKPLLVFPIARLPKTGKITDLTAFVHSKHISVPIPVFLVNSVFLDVLEGDNFFEKISELEPLLSESDVLAQELLMNFHLEKGLHCVGVAHVCEKASEPAEAV